VFDRAAEACSLRELETLKSWAEEVQFNPDYLKNKFFLAQIEEG